MPGRQEPSRPVDPVREVCAPFDLSTLERQGWDLLGRLSDAFDEVAWPILGGIAAWLHGCRVIWLMQTLKDRPLPLVVVAEPEPPSCSLSALVS